MSFRYEKEKGHGGQDSMWTSYSDLFLGLSVIFLLLYVTASLRQGTDGIRQHMEYQQLVKENQDYRQQLQVYSTLKQDYLKHEASDDEQSSYEELMGKLDLLQEQAKEEKIKLQAQATENGKKEQALNKYQQMIRNIMNANLIAKGRIHHRDTMIENQGETINEQGHEITSLEKNVAQKRAEIARGQNKIADLEENLDKRLKQLRNSYKSNQISKKKFEEQQHKLKTQAENQIADLRDRNSKAQGELSRINTELAQTQTALSHTQGENKQLQGALKSTKEQYDAGIAKLKNDFESQKQHDKTAFENAMAHEKLSANARAAKEAQYRADAERKSQELNAQMGALAAKYNEQGSQLEQTKGTLNKVAGENQKLKGSLASAQAQYDAAAAKLKGEYEAQRGRDKAAFDAAMAKEKLSGSERAGREAAYRAESERKAKALGDQLGALGAQYKAQGAELANAQENLNAKKKLADTIRKNFAKNGIKADVDPRTGDVVLAFGDQYFESGSSSLKPGMRKILEQAVPVYSSSLFENQKIADKISNVEIVGFASPTFKGKYIDPRSMNADDRAAVNYNLDLSYNRARAIFNHIFDQSKMQFKYQQKLLPLVKVTGRSFFDQANRDVASESPESFCRKNDCAKLQRVIIKFNLKD